MIARNASAYRRYNGTRPTVAGSKTAGRGTFPESEAAGTHQLGSP